MEQLLTLLTFRCRVLEKIPPFNAQEVKHPPVCGRLRDSGDPKSLSSASLPPQGLAVGHVFPHMAHQPANVDHFVGWEVQEDLLQDIHRGCEELTGHRYVKSASKHRCGIENTRNNTGANHNTNMGEGPCMQASHVHGS